MAIKIECGDCGKTYNVKDEMEGKKIRCKECSAVMVVRAQSEDEWGEEEQEEFQPPVRKTSKKKKRATEFGGRPLTVWIPVACVALLALMSTASIFQGAFGELAGWGGHGNRPSDLAIRIVAILPGLIMLVTQMVVLFGILNGSSVIRMMAIGMAGIMVLLYSWIFMKSLAVDVTAVGMLWFGALLGARCAIIGCLLTPSAARYFDR